MSHDQLQKPTRLPIDSGAVGYSESTKFIPIPPTIVAWLLQYSGSRVEHRDEFFFGTNDLQLSSKW